MNTLRDQLIGTWTLLKKELLRFWRVAFQTVAAPVITGILYLLIFSQVLGDRLEVYDGVNYLVFLIPGLIMMSLLQNSFSNSSSSLIQAKIMGNIVFLLLTPLSYLQLFFCIFDSRNRSRYVCRYLHLSHCNVLCRFACRAPLVCIYICFLWGRSNGCFWNDCGYMGD